MSGSPRVTAHGVRHLAPLPRNVRFACALVATAAILAADARAVPYRVHVPASVTPFVVSFALYDGNGVASESFAIIDSLRARDADGKLLDGPLRFAGGVPAGFSLALNPSAYALRPDGALILQDAQAALLTLGDWSPSASQPASLEFALDPSLATTPGPLGADMLVVSVLRSDLAPAVEGLTGLGDVLEFRSGSVQSSNEVDTPPPGEPFQPPGLAFAVYPNPSGSELSFRIVVPSAGEVRLDIFDVQGRRLLTPVQGPRGAGTFVVTLSRPNARELTPGVYFARLSSPVGSRVARFVRI